MQHIAALLLAATIGSANLAPAPSERSMAKVATGDAGTIAVWIDERSGSKHLYFALLDENGVPRWNRRLDELPPPPTVSSLHAGADDRGFLIVAGLYSVRVDAEGTVSQATRLPAVRYADDPFDLEWNGSAYVLSVNGQVLLLDRHGAALSGGIRIRNVPTAAVACSDGGCLLYLNHVTAADFPPVGEIREIETQQRMFGGHNPRVIAAPRGYFVVTTAGQEIHVQRLDETGTPLNGQWKYRTQIVLTADDDLRITAAADGESLIVYYWSNRPLLRFNPDGTIFELPASSFRANDAALLSTPNGVRVTWRLWRVLQTAILGEPARLLSFSRPSQKNPVLVEGNGAILAAWVETTGVDATFWTAIVDADGTPRTTPVQIARATRFYEPKVMVAFGAGKFFVAWQEANGDSSFARFVGTDGALLGEPFELFEDQYTWILISVASDGDDFYAASDYGIQRIRADGTIVNRTLESAYGRGGQWTGTMLAWDGTRFLSVYRGFDGTGCTGCPVNDLYFTTPHSRSLFLDGKVEQFAFLTWTMIPISPAVAARNGRALAVWVFNNDWFAATFTRSGVLSKRELPRFASRAVQPHAVAVNDGFLVAAGQTLASFDRDGRVTALTTIDRDALESTAVPLDGQNALAFFERIEDVSRLLLKPVATASPCRWEVERCEPVNGRRSR